MIFSWKKETGEIKHHATLESPILNAQF